jgi:hypothetical protein
VGLGDKRSSAGALEGLAAAAGGQEEWERATQLLGAAAALREAIGAPPTPRERCRVERSVAAARAALGEEAFAAAWAAGQALTWEDAVALALVDVTAPGARCAR